MILRRCRPGFRWSRVLVLVGLLAASAAPAAMREVVNASFEVAGFELELRGVSVSPDGSRVDLVLGQTPVRGRPGVASLQWASVGRTGPIPPLLRLEPSVPAQSGAAGGGFDAGSLVTSVPGGIVLLDRTPEGTQRLLRYHEGNGTPGIRELKSLKGAPEVRLVQRRHNGNLLLGGNLGLRAWWAEVTPEGEVVSQAALADPPLVLVDLVPLAGDDLVLLSQLGKGSDTGVGLVTTSAAGGLGAKNSWRGWPGDAVQARDGRLAVTWNRAAATGYTAMLTVVGDGLAPGSPQVLVPGEFVSPMVRIVAAGDGFLVAGAKQRGLWISRRGADGRELWTEQREPEKRPDLEMVSRVELLTAGKEFVIAYSAFVVRDRTQHRVVRVMRFTAAD